MCANEICRRQHESRRLDEKHETRRGRGTRRLRARRATTRARRNEMGYGAIAFARDRGVPFVAGMAAAARRRLDFVWIAIESVLDLLMLGDVAHDTQAVDLLRSLDDVGARIEQGNLRTFMAESVGRGHTERAGGAV